METILHWDIRVLGKVQGVFYRASTEQKAWSLGVKGYVKNLSDGSVFIEAEGTATILQRLVDWCKQGPPSARVTEVVVTEGMVKNYTRFDVRKD